MGQRKRSRSGWILSKPIGREVRRLMVKFKGWKTVTVNILLFVGYILGWDHLVHYVSPETVAVATTVVNFALRFATQGPVFDNPVKP